MTPFEEWWQARAADGIRRSGTIPLVSGQEAFEAGYRAAVKAHDASGCPRIFMETALKGEE